VQTRRPSVAFASILLALGCATEEPAGSAEASESAAESADSGETENDPTPRELLDACALPEPCTDWTEWNFCFGEVNQANYEAQDVCTFEALLAAPPNVVRAFTRGPACADVSESTSINIYRWADGSMTCVVGSSTIDGVGQTSSSVDVVDCSLPDTATIEACLADAQAALPVSETCLRFQNWGLEYGENIEPTCGS
jgi:hypothetical protein